MVSLVALVGVHLEELLAEVVAVLLQSCHNQQDQSYQSGSPSYVSSFSTSIIFYFIMRKTQIAPYLEDIAAVVVLQVPVEPLVQAVESPLQASFIHKLSHIYI